MSFAEKASLASKYYSILQNHTAAFAIISLLAIFIGAALFIGTEGNGIDDWSRITSTGVCMAAVGIIMILSTAVADTAPNPSDKDARMTTDKTIVMDYRQIPHYKKLAYQEYKYSKSLNNHQHIKIYESDKKYDNYHTQVIHMEHYLEVHSPKAPWINMRIG